jgi:hypothetical protein
MPLPTSTHCSDRSPNDLHDGNYHTIKNCAEESNILYYALNAPLVTPDINGFVA